MVTAAVRGSYLFFEAGLAWVLVAVPTYLALCLVRYPLSEEEEEEEVGWTSGGFHSSPSSSSSSRPASIHPPLKVVGAEGLWLRHFDFSLLLGGAAGAAVFPPLVAGCCGAAFPLFFFLPPLPAITDVGGYTEEGGSTLSCPSAVLSRGTR